MFRLFKHEISLFFPFIGGKTLDCLDTDPDSQSGSGSTDPIESGANPHPDPEHCFIVVVLFHFISVYSHGMNINI
jgi:hypothetical protein